MAEPNSFPQQSHESNAAGSNQICEYGLATMQYWDAVLNVKFGTVSIEKAPCDRCCGCPELVEDRDLRSLKDHLQALKVNHPKETSLLERDSEMGRLVEDLNQGVRLGLQKVEASISKKDAVVVDQLLNPMLERFHRVQQTLDENSSNNLLELTNRILDQEVVQTKLERTINELERKLDRMSDEKIEKAISTKLRHETQQLKATIEKMTAESGRKFEALINQKLEDRMETSSEAVKARIETAQRQSNQRYDTLQNKLRTELMSEIDQLAEADTKLEKTLSDESRKMQSALKQSTTNSEEAMKHLVEANGTLERRLQEEVERINGMQHNYEAQLESQAASFLKSQTELREHFAQKIEDKVVRETKALSESFRIKQRQTNAWLICMALCCLIALAVSFRALLPQWKNRLWQQAPGTLGIDY